MIWNPEQPKVDMSGSHLWWDIGQDRQWDNFFQPQNDKKLPFVKSITLPHSLWHMPTDKRLAYFVVSSIRMKIKMTASSKFYKDLAVLWLQIEIEDFDRYNNVIRIIIGIIRLRFTRLNKTALLQKLWQIFAGWSLVVRLLSGNGEAIKRDKYHNVWWYNGVALSV